MATVEVKVRALTDQKTGMEYDMVAIENRGRIERFPFKFSPLGTLDADVFKTVIEAGKQADFEAAVLAKVGVTIAQNPEHDDVKTDTDDDGVNDTGLYNWATYQNLYEIVA